MDADPRGREKLKRLLAKRKEDYKGLKDKKKKYFDSETLDNPYSDTRIIFGDSKKQRLCGEF